MSEVVALGELLIDFTDNGLSSQGNTLFEANPGGAPCNVLAMLNKLGHDTAFIGKIGNDVLAKVLISTLEEVAIDTSNLIMDEEVKTTLAFVRTYEDGDRDFSFFRNPGADMMLTKEEVKKETIKGCKIFHFGSLSMTHEGVKEATKYAIELAKKENAVLSFDPNLREPLWDNLEHAKEEIAYGMSQCDILKISDNEVEWFTGEKDLLLGIKRIRETYDIKLVMLSMGKEGSYAFYKDMEVFVPSFIQENTIETTGAGDTFGASCLHHVLKFGIENFDEDKMKQMLTFANAAASIITTKKGALRVMPTEEEIQLFLQINK